MKKVLIVVLMAITSLPFCLKAQEDNQQKKEQAEAREKKEQAERKDIAEKKETEEIVIRNKGDKALNLKVEINGDQITVNGKPLQDFKDAQVEINKRKITIRQGGEMRTFDFPDAMAFSQGFGKEWNNDEVIIKPFLGVTTEKATEGAKITEVVKASAAEKAGLKTGDIITKVDGETIEDGETLAEVISAKKPNELVKVAYLRNGKAANVKATLGERKTSNAMTFNYSAPRIKMRKFTQPRISGVPNADLMNEDQLQELQALTPGNNGFDVSPFAQLEESFPRQKKLGLKIQDTEEGGNVKVIDVEEGSAAEKAGLKKDDIITEIGGVKIDNTDIAREQLMLSNAKTAYSIKAKRGSTEMNFEVKIPKKLKTANL
jgi:serine protease Do